MSKDEKGGFRSWYAENGGKPSPSVLYSPKHIANHEKYRKQQEKKEQDEKHVPYVSIKNPSPTREDFLEYDADRRLKEKARDVRMSDRRKSRTPSKMEKNDEMHRNMDESPEKFYTPKRNSIGGIDSSSDFSFSTPQTSKKTAKHLGFNDTVTPSTSRIRLPDGISTFEYRKMKDQQLTEQMNRNWKQMMEEHPDLEKTIQISNSPQKETSKRPRSNNDVRSERGGYLDGSSRSSRFSSFDESSQSTPTRPKNIINQSIPVIPSIPFRSPIVNHSIPESSKLKNDSPVTKKKEDLSYVDALCIQHSLQLNYAVNADRMLQHLDKIADLKNMTKTLGESPKSLSTTVSTSSQSTSLSINQNENAREGVEENDKSREQKHEDINKVVRRIEQVEKIKEGIHHLKNKNVPYLSDGKYDNWLKLRNTWMSLPLKQFNYKIQKMNIELNQKIAILQRTYKELSENFLSRKNSRTNSPQKERLPFNEIQANNNIEQQKPQSISSSPIRNENYVRAEEQRIGSSQTDAIAMIDAETQGETEEEVKKPDVHDAETQMTAREEEVKAEQISCLTQTSPRLLGIEPLNLSSLKDNEQSVSIDAVNSMLNDIVLHDTSLADISMNQTVASESFKERAPIKISRATNESIDHGDESMLDESKNLSARFESSWKGSPVFVEDPPSSGRLSLDLASARKLSAGIAHFLEVHQNNSSFQNDRLDDTKFEGEDDDSKEDDDKNKQNKIIESKGLPIAAELLPIPNPIFFDDEGDETKKFIVRNEYEDDFESESPEENENSLVRQSGETMNDSADDSSFLLNDKPVPRLKSIFDNLPPSSSAFTGLESDTPRGSIYDDYSLDDSNPEIDVEVICRDTLMEIILPQMIDEAIKSETLLANMTHLEIYKCFKPPTFDDNIQGVVDKMEFYESFLLFIWGGVVDVLKDKYHTPGYTMNEERRKEFRTKVTEIMKEENNTDTKRRREWNQQVQLTKKQEGLNILCCDYRYEVRKNVSENERSEHQLMQIRMGMLSDHFNKKKITAQMNRIYGEELANSAETIITVLDASERIV